MLKHVIVEGPDGSGKSGLVSRLSLEFGFSVHPRASTSTGGPVDKLTEWYLSDMETIETSGPWVYDRHPLISERIYAPIARNEEPRGLYSDDVWVARERLTLAQHALVVWCLPAMSHVVANVNRNASDQMAGVAANIRQIYVEYTKPALLWPGRALYWDYTRTSYERLTQDIKTALMKTHDAHRKARVY